MEKKPFQVPQEILATHLQRFTHYILDLLFEYILIFILLIIVVAIAQLAGNTSILLWMQSMSQIEGVMLMIAVILLYCNITEILFSRSLAKFITGTIVVYEDGTRPSSETILIRSACRLIPFEHFSFLLSPCRGWHDTISKTYVVNKKKLEEMLREHHGIPQQ